MRIASILEEAEKIIGSPCSLLKDEAANPLICVGGECAVIPVQDAYGHKIAFRLYRTSARFASKLAAREVEFRRAIEQKGIRGFQRLLAFDTSHDNRAGLPYLALEWIEGVRQLQWTDTVPESHAHRAKVIQAIANICLDLLQINREGTSATKYYNAKIDSLAEAEQKFLGKQHAMTNHAFLRTLADKYVIRDLEDSPHVLVHGDLSGANILVDEDFNVQCIVDLGSAHLKPLQFAANFPLFLIHPREYVESKFDTSTAMSAVWHQDRKEFLRCVEERSAIEGGLVRQFYHTIRRPDGFDRYWWFRESTEINMHVSKASGRWVAPETFIADECDAAAGRTSAQS